MKRSIRTDLALEMRESFEDDNVEIKGVVLEEDEDKENKIKVSTVVIKDEKGSKAMQKPMGTYITIEAPKLEEWDEDYNQPLSDRIARHLKELAGDLRTDEVMVVGLGNREVTPDALGPMVVDNLFITRHLIREYGEEFKKHNQLGNVSAISPGVMAQTGMEAAEIVSGIIDKTHPKLLIVIDALAARSITRLNNTVQLTDTGISPGAGIGNNRKEFSEQSLGVKVIALGVPTVVDAATIVGDSLTDYMQGNDFEEADIEQFVSQVYQHSIHNMFVTPKNIDESVKRISYTISEAINSCFSRI